MRLIDADALKEEINKKKVVGRFNTLLIIDNAPTVAQPTGIWVNDSVYPYRCTNCGEYAANCYPFCPWCGAKMKGGETND